VILRLAISVEHRLVTDRQTDRHTTVAYTVLAWRCAVKNGTLRYDSTVVSPNITFHYHWGPFHLPEPPQWRGGVGSGLRRLCPPPPPLPPLGHESSHWQIKSGSRIVRTPRRSSWFSQTVRGVGPQGLSEARGPGTVPRSPL